MSDLSGKTPLIRSLINAFNILDIILENSKKGLTLSEISEKLGSYKSTTLRMLKTLESINCIIYDQETGRYRLGVHLLELGSGMLEGLDLRREVRPFLEEINRITGEVVHLAILDEDKVVYIDKIETQHVLRLYSRIGKVAPKFCTAVGKVLIAHKVTNYEEYIQTNSLKKYTERSIVDPDKMCRELKDVCSKGYGIDDQEHQDHVRCIAVPIRNYSGNVIAAISVTSPTVRMSLYKLHKIKPFMIDIAEKVSLQLGDIVNVK